MPYGANTLQCQVRMPTARTAIPEEPVNKCNRSLIGIGIMRICQLQSVGEVANPDRAMADMKALRFLVFGDTLLLLRK